MTEPTTPAAEPGPATTQAPRPSRGAGVGVSPRVHHYSIRDVTRDKVRRDLGNWRLLLVRIVVNGLAVAITVAVVPGLAFDRWYWGFFLLVGLVFGLLNAFVKPVIQFFTLRYLVASYGLVVVVVNALMLVLLAWILQGSITSRSLTAVLLGGFIVGVLSLVFETVAGATDPILDRRDDTEEQQ